MTENAQYTQNSELFFKDAFARNIGILTEEEQSKLKNIKVAIAGAGAVGSLHLLTLVRAGIGQFHIADMDNYAIENIQRQSGAFMNTMGKNKSDTMKNIALSINPHLKIQSFNQGVTEDNISEFLEGVDVLIDGIDFFCIDTRRMIFNEAYKRGIPAVTAGPLGFGSALLIFDPKGMSFDDYFDINDTMTEIEKLVAFGVGLAPAALQMKYINLGKVSLTSKAGPSLVSACTLCSALAVSETLKLVLNRGTVKSAPYYFQFDPYLTTYKKGYLFFANRNPWQKIKRWYLLKKFNK